MCPTADGGDDGKPCTVTFWVERQSGTSSSTEGSFTLDSNDPGAGTLTGATLEPPTKPVPPNNAVRIRAGVYNATRDHGYETYAALRLEDRDGRVNIMVHAGNYPEDTSGCILVAASTDGPQKLTGGSRHMVDKIRKYIDNVNSAQGAPTIRVVVMDRPTVHWH
ncbi:MAG: DUF5675 family protein [Gemmatimonadota bacterium]